MRRFTFVLASFLAVPLAWAEGDPDPAPQTGSFNAFLIEVRQQSKNNWRREFLSYSVNNFVREGYNMGPVQIPKDVGWTEFEQSVDAKVIYLSNAGGNDSNPCTEAEPCKTLAHGYAQLRNGMPDWLLLKRGDTWTVDERAFAGNWNRSGRSESEPMLISAYGQGPRPKIVKTGFEHETLFFARRNDGANENLAFVSLHLERAEGAAGPAVLWLYNGENVLFEDMLFKNQGIAFQDGNGALLTNLKIRRSLILDSYPTSGHAQGAYIDGVNGLLLEENVFDHNGWSETIPGAEPTKFNHNVYITGKTTEVVARGNIFARASATGMQARSGGIIENNLFVGNPLGLNWGIVFGGFQPPEGIQGRVVDNVFIDQPDRGVGNWGIGVANTSPSGSEISGNLIVRPNGTGLSMAGPNGPQPVQNLLVADNIIVDAYYSMRFIGDVGTDLLELTFKGNVLQNVGLDRRLVDFRDSSVGLDWSGNIYFSISDQQWFFSPDRWRTFSEWQSDIEPDAIKEQVQFIAPTRSVGDY